MANTVHPSIANKAAALTNKANAQSAVRLPPLKQNAAKTHRAPVEEPTVVNVAPAAESAEAEGERATRRKPEDNYEALVDSIKFSSARIPARRIAKTARMFDSCIELFNEQFADENGSIPSDGEVGAAAAALENAASHLLAAMDALKAIPKPKMATAPKVKIEPGYLVRLKESAQEEYEGTAATPALVGEVQRAMPNGMFRVSYSGKIAIVHGNHLTVERGAAE